VAARAGVLQHRGVVAWLRAWRAVPTAPARALVEALASITLAVVAGR
jgi:hypothetical protein